MSLNFAITIPMANESADFIPFTEQLKHVLNTLNGGTVYFVIDRATKDNTLELCQALSQRDSRFITLWAPENKHVVDAYRRGLQAAYQNGHEFIIEMDAGLSHDPNTLPQFIAAWQQGYDCAFGSRNIAGGSNTDSPLTRRFLSHSGTLLSKILLGTKLHDMTSGFQGFKRGIVEKILNYPIRSIAHFYQTEIRYLLRHYHCIEIPIHYSSPSPRVKWKFIVNSLQVLGFYTLQRFTLNGISL